METSSLLLTISQLAVGLAGFSAIIVALNPRPIRDWDTTDKLNLRALIQVSAFVLAFSLFPFLLAIPLPSEKVWLYGLWVYGGVHILDVTNVLYRLTKDIAKIFRISVYIGVVVALTQLAIAWFGSTKIRELVYVATLIWQLCVVFMGFLLLLYQVRSSDET